MELSDLVQPSDQIQPSDQVQPSDLVQPSDQVSPLTLDQTLDPTLDPTLDQSPPQLAQSHLSIPHMQVYPVDQQSLLPLDLQVHLETPPPLM